MLSYMAAPAHNGYLRKRHANNAHQTPAYYARSISGVMGNGGSLVGLVVRVRPS